MVVLNNWDKQIRDCYRNTVDCAREAADQIDPKTKQNFLDLKRGWLPLARSYPSEEFGRGSKNSN
jgi:hypothetical protein